MAEFANAGFWLLVEEENNILHCPNCKKVVEWCPFFFVTHAYEIVVYLSNMLSVNIFKCK
ncbi:hypothetical protein Hamer_G024020, partial [Homarus americanus]